MKIPKSVSLWWVVIAAIVGVLIAKAACKCTSAAKGRSSAYGATSYRAGT